ncbi:hypothetical protein JCM3263A_08380 [Thermobifida fusca]
MIIPKFESHKLNFVECVACHWWGRGGSPHQAQLESAGRQHPTDAPRTAQSTTPLPVQVHSQNYRWTAPINQDERASHPCHESGTSAPGRLGDHDLDRTTARQEENGTR